MEHASVFKRISLLICLIISIQFLSAQQDEKFKLEEVKQQCAALPLEKRARLSVTRFTVTTKGPGNETEKNVRANNRLKALGTIFNRGEAPQADKNTAYPWR